MHEWNTERKQRLPPEWRRQIQPRILARDAGVCHVCHKPGATEVDHIQAGDDHQDANLAAIHTTCHRSKTSAEGHAARATGPRTNRDPERHPGLT